MTTPDQLPGDAQKPADGRTQRGFSAAYLLLGAAPSGLLIGWLIDSAADTKPWFMLGCCTVFLAVALVHLLKALR